MILIIVYFALGFLIDLSLTAIVMFTSAIFALRQQLKDLGMSFTEVFSKMLTGQASIGIGHSSSSEKPSNTEYLLAAFIQFLSFGIASFIYFHVLPNTNLATGILLGTVWASIYAILQLGSIFLNNLVDKAIAKDKAAHSQSQNSISTKSPKSQTYHPAKPQTPNDQPQRSISSSIAQTHKDISTDESDGEDLTMPALGPWDICDVVVFFATPVLIYLVFFLS